MHPVSTTDPGPRRPSHCGFAPGCQFRERDPNAALGRFAGRLLSEEAEPEQAGKALEVVDEICPGKHFGPFFRGMMALGRGKGDEARSFFMAAEPLQPDDDSKALAAFYHAYSFSLEGAWDRALPGFGRAASLCPDMKEYRNMYGVSLFKLKRFAEAASEFEAILDRLDKGSVMDIQNLGMCHKELGNRELAGHFLRTALQIDPSLERAREALQSLYDVDTLGNQARSDK